MECYYCNKKKEQTSEEIAESRAMIFICDECLTTNKEQIKKEFPQIFDEEISDNLMTVKHLEKMKNTVTTHFSNAYNSLLMHLENNLISKSNGEQRNKDLLSDYDDEAQQQILIDLQKKMKSF